MEIVEAHGFHLTRDAEVVIKEFESDDLLETIEEAVWQRQFRAVVRLQVNQYIPAHILDDPDRKPGNGSEGCISGGGSHRSRQAAAVAGA